MWCVFVLVSIAAEQSTQTAAYSSKKHAYLTVFVDQALGSGLVGSFGPGSLI